MSSEDEEPTLLPQHVEATWLDRDAGSGSLSKSDDWLKNQKASYDNLNDGRSETNTTFYWKPEDTTPEYLRGRDRHQLHRDPQDRRSWSELAKWNDGMRKIDGTRKQDNFEADVRRWTDTFCSQLDLNQYQTDRVSYIIETVDLDGFGNIPSEHIILGVITLVVDVDVDVDPKEWTPDDWIVYRDKFEELMDAVGMDHERLWFIRKRVHKDSDLFEEDV